VHFIEAPSYFYCPVGRPIAHDDDLDPGHTAVSLDEWRASRHRVIVWPIASSSFRAGMTIVSISLFVFSSMRLISSVTGHVGMAKRSGYAVLVQGREWYEEACSAATTEFERDRFQENLGEA
jgi:hypothetical protein